MTDLQKKESLNISKLSPEEQELLLQKLQQNKIIRMEKEIQLLKEEALKRDAIMNEKLDELHDGVKKVINKQSRIESHIHSKDYLVRSNLGQELSNPALSAQRTTKLLKIIGVLKDNSNIPYLKYTEGYVPVAQKYKISNNSGYEKFDYKYNVEKIKTKWEKWLADKDLFDNFYNCETKKDLDVFIDNLFEQFCN